jgi:hypothetical protein
MKKGANNKKMSKEKSPKKEKTELGVCANCWRYAAFKEDCMFFWENKSECSKFMRHQFDEERHVRKGLFE